MLTGQGESYLEIEIEQENGAKIAKLHGQVLKQHYPLGKQILSCLNEIQA
jgi:hypothetical protein